MVPRRVPKLERATSPGAIRGLGLLFSQHVPKREMADLGTSGVAGCFTAVDKSEIIKNVGVILKSWKGIAHYLKAGVRTVQRWESRSGLPVYRAGSTERAPVFAYRTELDAWLHSRGARKTGARYRAENTPQVVARHGVLLNELTELMHVQGSIIAELGATDRALNKFCPALAKGTKRKCQIVDLAAKTR